MILEKDLTAQRLESEIERVVTHPSLKADLEQNIAKCYRKGGGEKIASHIFSLRG